MISESPLWASFFALKNVCLAHVCSYLAPQSSSVGSKKSDSLPSFCAGVADLYVVHTHTSLLIKLLGHTLSIQGENFPTFKVLVNFCLTVHCFDSFLSFAFNAKQSEGTKLLFHHFA